MVDRGVHLLYTASYSVQDEIEVKVLREENVGNILRGGESSMLESYYHNCCEFEVDQIMLRLLNRKPIIKLML